LFSGPHFYFFLKLRTLDTFKNILFFLILHFCKNLSLKSINWITSFYACSLALMISYMCGVLGGYESSYYAGLTLILLAMGLLMPWQARYTIFNSLIIYLSYILAA